MNRSPLAELVLPAIRWDAAHGFEQALEEIARAQEAGVGGFILFGGEANAVRALTADLVAGSPVPLLIASDLERGAGQQFPGMTGLPPLRGLAALGEAAVREAATITAREALDVGVNWVLAPVCDLDLEPTNPIVQTRALGADAFDVGHLVAVWVEACQTAGALACAKHFPGHGRTTLDSHETLPVVEAGRELERDLMPFRLAVEAGVATVMSSHVAYPAWEAAGVPATYSRPLLHDLLRGDLFFGGLVVTDALIMEGAIEANRGAIGPRAILEAGCDLLLYPPDPFAVIAGLDEATAAEAALADIAARAALRRHEALRRVAPARLTDAERAWCARRGAALCDAAVTLLRGEPGAAFTAAEVHVVDDDAGGPYALPSRDAFAEELARCGVAVRGGGARVVLLFADVKSWKGRAGLSADSAARLAALLERPATVVVFGHERRGADVPGDGPVLCAWSGDVAMQRAAARRLAGATAT